MSTAAYLGQATGRRGPLRRLRLSGDPASRGAAHGAAHRDEIRRYADERVRLASNGSWAGRPATRDDILCLAHEMLPAHRAYAPDLYDEMAALAHSSGLSLEEAVIVGGFTDFVDVVRARAGEAHEEDDCTAVLVPDTLADGRGFLAQTWDMHDSATEYVVLLDIECDDTPASLVFSTVGCVGQIGLNDAGIAVGINNLGAAAGQAGVTWPFVVRKALQQTNIDAALACVVDAELSGAHNYLLLDAEGRGFNVEAMPQASAVTKLDAELLFHTNHCIEDAAKQHEAVRAPGLVQSSQRRLARARELLASAPVTQKDLVDLTRDPEAICQRSCEPFHIESSGAAIMRPATRELWAVWGLPSENEYERFQFRAH